VNYTSTPVSTDLSAPLCQVVLARALELFCCEVKREALASAIKRYMMEESLHVDTYMVYLKLLCPTRGPHAAQFRFSL